MPLLRQQCPDHYTENYIAGTVNDVSIVTKPAAHVVNTTHTIDEVVSTVTIDPIIQAIAYTFDMVKPG